MPPKSRNNSKNQKNQRTSTSKGKGGDKNKIAPKKAVIPPKNPNPNSNFKPKRLPAQFAKKFEDKYQDYFQGEKNNKNEGDDFMFNKTPIMVSKEKVSDIQKSFNKKRKKIQQLQERKQKLVDIDMDSDEEDFGFNVSKKQQEEDDLFQDKGDAFFNSMKYGFTQYFMLDKNQEAMITKIPKLNLKEGTGLLAVISDKGPAGNYLEVSYGRNEKGYIARVDIAEEDQQQDTKLYNIGEYVQVVVIPGVNPKKVQLSLKPSVINKGLNFEDIFAGMVLQGKLDEEEDFGYKVNLFTQDKCIAFLKLNEEDAKSVNVNKVHLFHVLKVDKKKRVIQLSIFDNQQFPKIEADQDEMMGLDMSSVVKPGNLVNCTVSKVLENGLLVKFLKIFNGYIFQDYLQEPLTSYKPKQKLQARIILTNYEAKQINLSQKQIHLDLIPQTMKNVEEQFQIGERFQQGFLVKKCLFGNSFIVELENDLKQKFEAFLKGKNVQIKEELMKEGITVKKPLKIKAYNYFDQIPEVTAINDEIQKKELLWSHLEVGGYYNGTIGQVKQVNNRYRILVQISETVKGMIDSNNITDSQLVILPKHLVVGRKIKVRILSIDRESKKLALTIKPSLMEQDGQFITKFTQIEVGKQYTGFISKALDFGFIVSFFNDITGILTYADIESTNEFTRKSFKVGQSLEVYVAFVNPEEKKLGLTLSDKGVDNKKLANQQQKRVQSILDKLPALEKVAQKADNIFIGQKLFYTIDRTASESLTEVLILKHKDNKHEQDHKAVVLKQHLSDYSEHYEPLFNYYKQNEANPKIQAVVIGKLENGYVQVTFKPTIVNNPNHYKTDTKKIKKGDILIGYADYQTKNGTIVKLSEELNGFAQSSENFKTNINFADTLILTVKKIDQDKIYFQIANNLQITAANLQAHPFIGYLNEDFIINRKFLNSNLKKWQKFKIGNIVQGKVSLIKEYGVILNIEIENGSKITGFITNENLSQKKADIQIDQEIHAQILDIDYEKEIIDLKQAQQEKSANLLNLEIAKKNIAYLQSSKIPSKLLLKKDHYQICEVQIQESKETVLVISEIKCLNQQNEALEIQEDFDQNTAKRQESQLTLQMINQSIFGKNCSDVHAHNKAHFLPIFTNLEKLNKKNDQEKQGDMEVEEENNENQKKSSENKKIYSQLKEGGKISGEIISIKSNTYVVKITASLNARLHKNQVQQGQQESLKVGQHIDAKILHIKKDKYIQIELTTLEAHMKLGDGKLNQTLILDLEPEQFLAKYQNQPLTGIIKSIDAKSIKPIYVEFSHEHQGYLSCFTGLANLDSENLFEEVEKVKNLKQHFKVGQEVQVYVRKCENIKNIEVSLNKNTSVLDVGSISVGRVVGNNGKKIRFQIEPETFASVDITQISDAWLSNPFQKYTKGSLVPFRIISQNVSGEFELSLRESFLNKNNWEKALSPQTGTTLNFKKLFKDQESSGDVRNRVYKLGPGCLKVGMIVIGYVNETNNNGCYVKISTDLSVRAQLNEISDAYVAEPKSQFYKNKLVIARIIKIKEDGKIDISLRESVIKFGYSLSLDDFNVGQTVKGIVSGHSKGKAQVQLNNCKYRGQITLKELQIPEGESGHKHNYLEVVLPKGSEISAKVVQILKEPPILKLSTLQKHFQQYANVQPKKPEETYPQEIQDLIQQIAEISAQNTEQEQRAKDIQIQVQQQQKNLEEFEENESQEQYDLDESDEEEQRIIRQTLEKADSQIEEENDSEDIEEEGGDEEEDDEEDKINNLDDFEDEQEGEEGEDQEDEEEEDQEGKKVKQLNKSEKRKLEQKIRIQEQKLLNESAIPESEDDFEKLILKNPNSSYVWIKYIAFKMEQSGIEEARITIERAIKVINTTNQNQLLNVWTTYMNLEHNFGSETKLIEVFKRATEKCKPKDVYFRLLEIYKNTGKYDLILELSKNMIKKFKHSSKVWLEHMKNIQFIKQQYVDQGNTQEAEKYDLKEILKRALQVVKNKKHIIILTHYARIMYIQNQPEQGRTTFEAILQNYPKRTDIWSIYLDMETKYGNQLSTRNLYERCINMSFKLKQMKFFYKRYLQFEMQNGNEKEAELVKQKAQEYIQSLMPEDDDEQQQDNENNMEEE